MASRARGRGRAGARGESHTRQTAKGRVARSLVVAAHILESNCFYQANTQS